VNTALRSPAQRSVIESLATPIDVRTQGPAFLRLDALLDALGIIYAPATQTVAFSLFAYLTDDRPIGASARARSRNAIRSNGPYLWLPRGGTWSVEFVSDAGLAGATRAAFSVFEGQEAETIAQSYFAGGSSTPARFATGIVVIPAANSTDVFGGGLAAFDIPQWFACCFLRIQNGAGAAVVALGQPAAVGTGLVLAANASITKTWAELAGCSVSVFSTAGTTYYWEARFP